jgi:hypothetical protein
MNRPENRSDELTQTPWLERARAQSQRRAEEKGALLAPPMAWEPQEGKQKRRAPGLGSLGLRLSWVTALVLVLVASGATGTYAYVRHLKVAAAKAQKAAEARATAKKQPTKIKAKAHTKRRVVKATLPAAPPVTPPLTLVAKKGKPKKRANKPEAAPEESPATKEQGEIMFDDPSMPGGGHVIIVRPPAKIGPLFEVEKYRQKGPGGMSW